MNKTVTSKEDITRTAKAYLLEHGSEGFSMRTIASACGVAVGSLYNYFPSKGALLSAVVVAIWQEIFGVFHQGEFAHFDEAIESLCRTLKESEEKYPHFLVSHSLQFTQADKKSGRVTMHQYFIYVQEKLVHILEQDEGVREGVFDADLSKEKFVEYILKLIFKGEVHGEMDVRAITAMVRACIY